jgi:hypothetical protein
MKLTPHAQKLADDWLDQDGDLRELVEIIGLSRGGIGAELKGRCYRPVHDTDFSPFAIESFINDDLRLRRLVAGQVKPTAEEMAVWRQAQWDAQETTAFFIWKVPFTRGARYILTMHGKNGYVEKVEGPFHSADAALPFGEIVYN